MPDKIQHQRVVYNILDFIGDIGGLSDGISYLCIFLIQVVWAIQGNPLSVYLINQLFYRKKGVDYYESPLKGSLCSLRKFSKRREFLKLGEEKIDDVFDIDKFILRQ